MSLLVFRRQWPNIILPIPAEVPPQQVPAGPNSARIRAMQDAHDILCAAKPKPVSRKFLIYTPIMALRILYAYRFADLRIGKRRNNDEQ